MRDGRFACGRGTRSCLAAAIFGKRRWLRGGEGTTHRHESSMRALWHAMCTVHETTVCDVSAEGRGVCAFHVCVCVTVSCVCVCDCKAV